MSNETQTTQSSSRLKFWLLRVLKTAIGGFLTGILSSISTMLLRDMGLLSPEDQTGLFALLTVAAWIAWLVYLVMPLFRRRRPATSAKSETRR
jgi:hypothetical protein